MMNLIMKLARKRPGSVPGSDSNPKYEITGEIVAMGRIICSRSTTMSSFRSPLLLLHQQQQAT